jgi:hypothetical protein
MIATKDNFDVFVLRCQTTKKISSCGSLLTSNIGYGDIMIGIFSNLHIFPGKF